MRLKSKVDIDFQSPGVPLREWQYGRRKDLMCKKDGFKKNNNKESNNSK